MRKNSILSIFLFFAFSISAYAQQITGSVTDENGIPLPGASVLVKGTTKGAQTDFDGKFQINSLTPGSYDVEISNPGEGYQATTIKGVVVSALKNADRTCGNLVYIDFETQNQTIITDTTIKRSARSSNNKWLDNNTFIRLK
mgnify:CR=1 FL=1